MKGSSSPESAAALNELLARMSHDVNAPLNTIVSLVDSLLGDAPSPDHCADLRDIRKSARTLRVMVKSLCELAKSQAGTLIVNNHRFTLSNMLTALVQDFKDGDGEAEQTVVSKVSTEVPARIIGDAFKFQQVLWNIVQVAQDLSAGTGKTSIEVDLSKERGDESVLMVRVSDTHRCSEQQREMIHRALTDTDERFGSDGRLQMLPLRVAQILTVSMGGTFSAQSDADGGTEYHLSIPNPSAV